MLKEKLLCPTLSLLNSSKALLKQILGYKTKSNSIRLLRIKLVVLLLICCAITLSFVSIRKTKMEVNPISLPLEVLGEDGYTVSVTVEVEDAVGIDQLYMKIHRPVFRDVSTNPARGPKASIRINNGKWIGISNSTAEAFPHEEAYGGINGSYHTIRMNMPIQGILAGENTLSFRFNGTDGLTSGFRVLEFNLVKGGQHVLPAETFIEEDPSTWSAPLTSSTDIQEGKRLWETGVLYESPLNTTKFLLVSCADCHAKDGRDLKYFNYSNWSIKERSKFHGLSDKESDQIASYIRSLDVAVPAVARPWNPPYQPGPLLDSKPVNEWAAGAGLDWVLEEDIESLDYAFDDLSVQSIAKVFDADSYINLREIPVSIQFPDWNGWLAHTHPADLVGEAFYEVSAVGSRSYQDTYEELSTLFQNNSPEELASKGILSNLLNQFTHVTSHFDNATAIVNKPALRQGKDSELLLAAISQWGAVKQWELMHTFGLEDKAYLLYGDDAAPRSWLTERRNVFDIAPHRAAKNISHFEYQSKLEGKFFSTVWYQLQTVLNTGNRDGYNLGPVDWNYHPNHIGGLWGAGGPRHPVRWYLSISRMIQEYNDGRKVGTGASTFGFRQIHPGRYARRDQFFGSVDPQTTALIITGLLNATMDVIEAQDLDDWPRTYNFSNDNQLRPSDYVPKVFSRNEMGVRLHEHDYEDAWMTMIPLFEKDGVDKNTLRRLVDWGKAMWPGGDWENLVDLSGTVPGPDPFACEDTLNAVNPVNTTPGLKYEFYEGNWRTLPNFDALSPLSEGTTDNFDISLSTKEEQFGFRFTGYIDIPSTDRYTFFTTSDDGSKLYIDGLEVVDNDGLHGDITAKGRVCLEAGKHEIVVTFFEQTGGKTLRVEYASSSFEQKVIPDEVLSSATISTQTPNVKLSVMLEGFLDEKKGEMRTQLQEKSLIPSEQPFFDQVFGYEGSETMESIPGNAVDWILVEIRDPENIAQILAQQAALLTKSGLIIDMEGKDFLSFPNLSEGSYYITLYHWGHLAVMSAVPVPIKNIPQLYDFSVDEDRAMGLSQLKKVGTTYCMYAGDFDANGILNNKDFNLWKINPAVIDQYAHTDADGNGIINNKDFNLWKINAGKLGIRAIQK